jgi:multidrug efflux pump subunit AcrB
MWIVRLALERPRTIIVMALLIFLLGGLYILQMPKDIFPAIDVPVVAVIWTYSGLPPVEMDRRVVRLSESAITTSVDQIEHIESQSLSGYGIIKVYFQPGTSISSAITQISATSQAVLRGMPQGITPPEIIQYDASDVPIVQLAMSSDTVSMTKIVDIATNTISAQLATVRGASLSPTEGGSSRLINVDLDTQAMSARGVTAQQVTNAIGSQDLILPAGDAKMGVRDYFVRLNNSPTAVEEFNSLPVAIVNGAMVFVRDVAHVRDGSAVQISMVRVNSKPAVLLTLLKNGSASTLDVVDGIKQKLPQIRALLPADVKLDVLLDQSVYVRGSIEGVLREAAIAAGLTGLMILLFLGSWRNTIIVAISIPLSILASIVVLGFMGYTLNTLTLGGMALAVGMLVDDATVAVENTTRNLEEKHTLLDAILISAEQVALPALTATLSICIVFVPVVFLTGVAQSLFLPLALAVVFAMLPSYILSRTLVTTMMQAMLGKELDLYDPSQHDSPSKRNIIWRVHEKFEHHFENVRDKYRGVLQWTLHHRGLTCFCTVVFFAASACLLPFIGEDFFPKVDAGQLRLHVRVPPGTRLEETAKRFSQIEDTIRQVIPTNEVGIILDNIGLASGIAYVRSAGGTIGAADGEIDISLAENHHSTWGYMTSLRKKLQATYPDCEFFYQPADMPTQVLDFGTSAPIDIQVLGSFKDMKNDYALAQQILNKVSHVSGITDAYIYQVQNAPEILVNVNRTRALQMGVTQQDVANNVLVSLSSSTLFSPSYYLDPENGFEYTVAVQTPQYQVADIDSLLSMPISSVTQASGQVTPELLGGIATIGRDTTPEVVSSYNILPSFDVFASVENRDLGGATRDVQKLLAPFQKKVPRGTQITVNGQALTMQSSFLQLGLGLIFAIVLVYLLLTVNFESWVDPLVILMASPGALSGVLWGLFATQSTFNVPSLMGAIMSVGVATANSILVVTFANQQRDEGKDALEAALEAGFTRFRPIIMTALAMLLGMLPMALGIGEGGEQNAPLGRAVIGGLSVATFTTLFFVPIMYTVLRKHQPDPMHRDLDARQAAERAARDGRNGHEGSNGSEPVTLS